MANRWRKMLSFHRRDLETLSKHFKSPIRFSLRLSVSAVSFDAE